MGRVLPRSEVDRATAIAPSFDVPRGHITPALVVDAACRARTLLTEAKREAERIIEQARAAAEAERPAIEERVEAAARAKWAAEFIRLEADKQSHRDDEAKRVAGAAGLLAERLVGEALEGDPAIVVARARQVLDQAAGARRAKLEAHPADADVLRRVLSELAGGQLDLELETNTGLERGSLVLRTDVGDVDARLSVQLERLVHALESALRTE